MPPISLPSTETTNWALPFHASSETRRARVSDPLPTVTGGNDPELPGAMKVKCCGPGNQLAERCARNHAIVDRGARHVEVAIGGRRAAIGVVEEVDGRGVAAGGECSPHVENLCLSRRMRGGRGLSAADLAAIDRDGELRIAIPRILGNLQRQRIGPAADCDYGRR